MEKYINVYDKACHKILRPIFPHKIEKQDKAQKKTWCETWKHTKIYEEKITIIIKVFFFFLCISTARSEIQDDATGS